MRKFKIKQTVVTVTDASSVLVGSNLERRYLAFQVVSGNDVCVSTEATCVFGRGIMYTGPVQVGKQGASEDFSGQVPTNGFTVCCATGNTALVVVWEG